MPTYPGIYRARASKMESNNKLSAYVPQVFGDVLVTIENFIGSPPSALVMGWVSFQGGMPEFPVWHGAGTGTGSISDVLWVDPNAPTEDLELWWDTDEPVPLDDRYALVAHRPRHFNSTGVAIAGGAFSTETVVNTLNVSAQLVAGIVYVWSSVRVDKTVAGDTHFARLRETNTSGALACDWPMVGLQFNMATLHGSYALAANTAGVYVTTLFRQTGTGNATTTATASQNRMTALWVAS